MPNFSYTANKAWTPYTFEEMLKPLAMYTAEYNQLEESLSALEAEANTIGAMINNALDRDTYERYKNYEDAVKKLAEALAKQGLSPSSRKAVLDLRARYKKDITPIGQAYNRRQELINEQRKALLSNPNLMYDIDFNTVRLSDLIANPNMSYTPVNGDDLYKKGKEAAISASSRNISIGSALQGQYWAIRQGYGADAANEFLLNQSSIPELQDAVNRIVSQSKVTDTNKARAIDYVISGIMSGLSYKESYQANRESSNSNGNGNLPTGGLAINPSNIYNNRELEEEEKMYRNNISNFSLYFEKKDGQWEMTLAGYDAYHRKEDKWESANGAGSYKIKNADSNFKRFIDGLGGKGNISSDGFGSNLAATIGKLWSNYVANSPAAKTAMYDAAKASEIIYDLPQTEEYQKNFKSKVQRAIGSDETLYEVDLDNGEWKKTGNKLTLKEFLTPDFHIISRAPGDFGETWFIGDKEGKARRYSAIPGINLTAEGGGQQAMEEMRNTQELLKRSDLTPQQRLKLEEHYKRLKQLAVMFEAQLDFINKTEAQNIKPYYIP